MTLSLSLFPVKLLYQITSISSNSRITFTDQLYPLCVDGDKIFREVSNQLEEIQLFFQQSIPYSDTVPISFLRLFLSLLDYFMLPVMNFCSIYSYKTFRQKHQIETFCQVHILLLKKKRENLTKRHYKQQTASCLTCHLGNFIFNLRKTKKLLTNKNNKFLYYIGLQRTSLSQPLKPMMMYVLTTRTQ